jgi:hypothetical protein
MLRRSIARSIVCLREVLMKRHLMRLDRIAGEMNAWLLVIAIGLGMLDLAVLIAKCIPAVAVPSPTTSAPDHQHAVRLLSQADNPRS